ncbi:hypothetical protein HOY80DRAFT_1054155 [Tuber brumale]|nr:hypothetical protein HOY80DRAFT_1054155 [Tuber brumale]
MPAESSKSSAKTSSKTKQYAREILPPPDVAQKNRSLTFDEFFTGGCPPGINPQECLIFDLENFWVIAGGEIQRQWAVTDE